MRKKLFKVTICINVIVLLFSCNQNNNTLTIAIDNKTDYDIVLRNSDDSVSMKAAVKLRDYLFRMTGAKPDIHSTTDQAENHFFIGKNILKDSLLLEETEKLHEQGFFIKTKGKDIYLTGKNAIGNLYAVSTFLEEYLGCMKYNVKEEFVPVVEKLQINTINKTYNPSFNFRVPHFSGRWDREFCEWHKISNFDDWGLFVHTFHKLLDPHKYFKEHPEYFAMMDGKRVFEAQPCLSNENVIKTLIENLRIKIRKQPDKIYWSVSQNDYFNYCECDKCKAKYDEYGSISGLYIEMANKIAREFPDKQISTLAYQFTRSAPKNIKPAENVNVMFCSIECNRSAPLNEDKRNKSFINDLNGWSAITENIFMWDYIVQFKNLLCPFPNFHIIKPNIKLFEEYGVDMMFQQGSGYHLSDLSDLKQYLVAKLLWNTNLEVDSVVQHFINSYYGKAAPFIYNYYELMHENMIKNIENTELNIYGFPQFYHDSFLSNELMIKYKELMDNAEKAVMDDSVYLKRVLKQRLSVDFAYVDIALNIGDDELSCTKINKDGKLIKNQEIYDLLEKMAVNSKVTRTKSIRERSNSMVKHIAYVKRRIDFLVADNLLKNAKIISRTKYSNTYDVGGEKAINDNVTGGLTFHLNWLGYQGEDMILDIDLTEEKELSSVKMNFLRDNLSWVFLPSEIDIEISEDGNKYQSVANYKADSVENIVLDTPIPFDFAFDKVEARYMKITAKSIKKCPEWHRGSGGNSWIFIDEIVVQ